MTRLLAAIVALLVSASLVYASRSLHGVGPSSGNFAFTPLHTYYLAATSCNDANAGTSAGSPWCSPNHRTLKCGDVIIAKAGNYTGTPFGANKWGAVSNCPSTTGGIDGTGGVYFATILCEGPHLGACAVDGSDQEAFRVDASNWAVEGFTVTQSASSGSTCFVATSETGINLSFIAFINNVASTCGVQGFAAYYWNNNHGVDQSAVVGAIAYNTASSSECWQLRVRRLHDPDKWDGDNRWDSCLRRRCV